ncbi:unnamed protein product [Vitrella brassicaformis CCMP3155]|uniref:Uncharacterized protein n=1 Tax=Vitrella brassicaformis (strain CCMP3155) TaxID=1169540 RepID=A0A0G4G6F8_VITBC|nr:unnamed protein product [Vitrella brassicaformis CCMP3155]|eukprot:CEM24050.1 unnamed protein product [Vitrella brassicaformis CCMP3155]
MLELVQQHIEEELVRLGLQDVLSFTISDLESGFKVVYLLERSWEEVAEVLQLASQCGCCTLPVNLTADDINKHADETAYMSVPRVLAQLMVVGRRVRFSDGSCLQIFRHPNGEVRAIKDEPAFRLALNPHLAAHHLYQRHRRQDDPPVSVRGEWVSVGDPFPDASVSSFAKRAILDHFLILMTHKTNRTFTRLNSWFRRVGDGRLDDLLTQSPHTPVAGCITTFSQDGRLRYLVLTDSSHKFVVWIWILDEGNGVALQVETTDWPVWPLSEWHHTCSTDNSRRNSPSIRSSRGADDSDDDEDGGGESEAEGDDDDDGDVDGGDDDDDDMHPNDGQEASGGSDEYSELLGREGPSSAHTGQPSCGGRGGEGVGVRVSPGIRELREKGQGAPNSAHAPAGKGNKDRGS